MSLFRGFMGQMVTSELHVNMGHIGQVRDTVSLGGQAEKESGHVRVHRRGVPMDSHPSDTGCEASPSCLQCPLPLCKYDVPGGLAAAKYLERDAAIRQAYRERSATEVAKEFGVSVRTVYRVQGES